MLRKNFESEQQHIDPQADDLALIRKFTQRDVQADEIWTGRQKLANTQIDRAHERFPVEYLQRFAETLPGRSVMGGHDYDTLPLGRYYRANVQKDDNGHYLQADYYLRADSPHVASIELGILKDVSIGYNAGKRVCDLCEKAWSPYGLKDGCEHWPGSETDDGLCTLTYCPTEAHKAEAMEGSFVWAGCQYGAEAVPKSAWTDDPRYYQQLLSGTPYSPFPNAGLLDFLKRLPGVPQPGTGDPKMPPTVEELQAALASQKDAHEKAAGELQKQLAELKSQAADGEWGRTYLKERIAWMAGLLGQTDSYAVVLEALKDAPVEKLLPTYEEIGKRFDAKFPKPIAATDGAPDPNENRTTTVSVPWFRRRAA